MAYDLKMRTLTDYEGIKLSTGEKTRYVVGNGERISEKNFEILKAAKRAMKHIVEAEDLGLHPTSEIFNFRMD